MDYSADEKMMLTLKKETMKTLKKVRLKIKPMDSIKSLTALARLFLGLLEFGYSASLFSHSRLQFLNILE